jgi:hypothetical protein
MAENSYSNLGIEPLSFKIILAKGEHYTGQITVTNDNNQSLSLQFQPEYWRRGTCTEPISQWLKASPENISIDAHSKKNITFRLVSPKIDGECLVMMFLAGKETGKNITLRSRVGIPLYIRERKAEILKAEIATFKAVELAGNKVSFKIVINNLGNVHLLPYGILMLQSSYSKKNYQEEIRFEQPIFSKESGEISVQYTETIPPGKYSAKLFIYLDSLYNTEKNNRDLKVLTANYDSIIVK